MKAFILDGEAGGETIRSTDSFADVERAHAAGKNLWVELDERDETSSRFLEQVLHIHPLAIEDVWNDVSIPKLDDFGDYLQLVVHGVRGVDRESEDLPLALTELDLLIGKNFLVTHAHDERACAITPVQNELSRSARLLKKGPAWVAHAVLDRMVDEYMPILERFDEQIDDLEAHILNDATMRESSTVIPRIIRLKRSLQMLRRITLYQREILLRLARTEFDEIPDDLAPFYRDIYDHFARVTELVDSYRDLVASLLEAHLSLQSNRMNEVMKRLTIISTIMLPLTMIAGVYGMNFEHMPELKWVWGYPFALGLMVTVAASILYWFKVKRWL